MENEENKITEDEKEETITEKVETIDKSTKNVEESTNEEIIVEENKQQNCEIVPKNKNNKKGLVIGIVVVIAIIAAYLLYNYLNNPKNIFLKSINNSYKEFEKIYDEVSNNEINKLSSDKAVKESVTAQMNIKMDDSLLDEDTKNIIDELNKLKINAEYGIDSNKKEMYLTLDSKYDNEDLLGASLYASEEKMYIDLKELFDKYIEIPVEEYDAIFSSINTNKEDGKYIVKTVKDSFVNNLNKNEFTKSKATVTINGKKIKTTKIEYGFSEKNILNLGKAMLKELKENSKFIEKLSKISGVEKSTLKETIEELIEEVNTKLEEEEISTEKIVKLATYVKGINSQLVGYSFSVKDEEESIELSYLKNNKVKEIKIKQNDEELGNIIITEENNDGVKITGDISGLKIKIDKTVKNDKITYDYKFSMQSVILSGKLESEIKQTKKSEKYSLKNNLTMNLKSNSITLATISIKSSGKIETVSKLDIPDTSNSIDYNELSEEDYNAIISKLTSNNKLMEFISKISNDSTANY